jgi:hypothetical protein
VNKPQGRFDNTNKGNKAIDRAKGTIKGMGVVWSLARYRHWR